MSSILDQVSYLATQQYVDQFRTGSAIAARQRRKKSAAASSTDSTRPSSQDSFATAFEALELSVHSDSDDSTLIAHGAGNVPGVGEGDGLIVATPMGVVRPWPREGGQSAAMAETNVPGRLPAGDEGRKSSGSQHHSKSAATVSSSERPGLWTDESSESEGSSADWVVSTPMGIVRPTRLRHRRPRSKAGTKDSTPKSGQRPTKNEEKQRGRGGKTTHTSPSKRATGHTLAGGGSSQSNYRPVRSLLDFLGPNAPIDPRGSGFQLPLSLYGRPPHTRSPPENRAADGDKEDKESTASTDPSPKEAPSGTTIAGPASTSATSTVATLTLLTEDLAALTTSYERIFNATVTSSSSATATLFFPSGLTVVLRTSQSARDARTFGEGVAVGRTAAMPKRAMVGVEVADVTATWRRLRTLGVGQAANDGAEVLGDVMVGEAGRRSLCIVDLAGHCWEFWQRPPGRG